jgi:signal peptidase II
LSLAPADASAGADFLPTLFPIMWFYPVIILTVIAVDHLTKWMTIIYLKGEPPVTIIPGLLEFHYAENPGAAFSIMEDNPLLLTIVATFALGIIIWLARSIPKDERVMRFAFALIIGGAIGNLIDRYSRGFVVDFISAHYGEYYWPTFNIADSAISCGTPLVIWRSFFMEQPEDDKDGEEESESDSEIAVTDSGKKESPAAAASDS